MLNGALFFFFSFYCVFYTAAGGGVTLDHQVDHALLTVAEAAAQVIAEVEATGLWFFFESI